MVFGVVLATLVGAIPALGYTGVQRLLRSRDGRITVRTDDPAEPGYEALVEPTPTALVVQVDADGAPQSLTVIALGAGDTGGSVIFVPIDTRLEEPAFLVDRLRLAYQDGEYRAGMDAVVGRLLGIGFTEVVEVDDARWAALVAPVAPLAVENPDAVSSDGDRFASGPLALEADQVGSYLLAKAGDEESDLNRMNRQELLWRSWLASVGASDQPDPVPGETDAGIGRFVSTLARGTVDYQVLPVVPVSGSGPDQVDGRTVFAADAEAVGEVVTAAVPFPVGGGAGQRYRVKVLNGVRGEVVPTAVTDRLVAAGAQIDVLGNARRFAQDTTTVEYYDASHADDAEAVRDALDAGEVELRQGLTDSIDVTVTVGSDVLDALDPGSDASDPDRPGGSAGSAGSAGSSGSSAPDEDGDGGTSPTDDDEQGGGGG